MRFRKSTTEWSFQAGISGSRRTVTSHISDILGRNRLKKMLALVAANCGIKPGIGGRWHPPPRDLMLLEVIRRLTGEADWIFLRHVSAPT